MSRLASPLAAPLGGSSIASLVINYTSRQLFPGQTIQLTATAIYSDGTTVDVTSSATWKSTNPAAVSVSAGLIVAGLNGGSAVVTATI